MVQFHEFDDTMFVITSVWWPERTLCVSHFTNVLVSFIKYIDDPVSNYRVEIHRAENPYFLGGAGDL